MDQRHDRLQAEAPVHARHPGEGLAHDEGDRVRVMGLAGIDQGAADVATAASVKGLRLVAEVAQDGVVTTGAALGPADQLEEEAPLVLDHRGIRRRALGASLDEGTAEREVARRDEQETEGVRAVPSRAPHFLVVGLDRAGRSQVDHRAHVRAVDAHAEGIGRHHDLGAGVCEVALRSLARGR